MAHMAACPACQAYFDDQIAIHDAMDRLGSDAPEGFAEQVMARVRITAQESPRKKIVSFPHWRRWTALAACCAAAALGVWAFSGGNPAASWSRADQAASVQYNEEYAMTAAQTDDTSGSVPQEQAEGSAEDGLAALTLEPGSAAASAVRVPTGCQLSKSLGSCASRTPQRFSISRLQHLCSTSSSSMPEASE